MSDDPWSVGVPADEADPGIDVLAGLYPSVERLRAVVEAQRRALELLADDSDVGATPEQEVHGMRLIARTALDQREAT